MLATNHKNILMMASKKMMNMLKSTNLALDLNDKMMRLLSYLPVF